MQTAVTLAPTSTPAIFQASDAACRLLKYGFADPEGSVWGGATARCFNGAKYLQAAETWVTLVCCPAGATPSSTLAKYRDTRAEGKWLAKARDTRAEGAWMAKARETRAESGPEYVGRK
jgi:hypothetical protein